MLYTFLCIHDLVQFLYSLLPLLVPVHEVQLSYFVAAIHHCVDNFLFITFHLSPRMCMRLQATLGCVVFGGVWWVSLKEDGGRWT